MKIKDMTNEQLITESQSLHTSIYINDCFSLRDLINYELICKEMERRGYTIQENLIVVKV